MFVKLSVNQNQLAFLYKNEKFKSTLDTGSYKFMSWGHEFRLSRLDKSYPLLDAFEAEILLKEPGMKERIKLLLVDEQERVLVMIDGLMKTLLGAGRYFFYDPEDKVSFTRYSIIDPSIGEAEALRLVVIPSASTFIQFFNVEDGMKGLLYYNNQRMRSLDPGQYYFWKTARAVSVKKIDIRSQALEVQGQELMTRDKVTLRINLSVRFKVIDVIKALEDLQDHADLFYRVVQMALREVVSTKTLDELLANKSMISTEIELLVRGQCKDLGMELEASGIRDIILPGEMKTILNQVIEAEKRSQANMIQRREETAATRSLLNTAKLLEDNPILLRLKELEASERIAEKIGSISVTGGLESLFKAIQPASVLKV